MLQTPRFNDENMSQIMQSPTSKKRKRNSAEASDTVVGTKRTSLSHTNGNSDHMNGDTYGDSTEYNPHLQSGTSEPDISSTAAAALTAHLSAPDPHQLSFGASSGTDDRHLDESFSMGDSAQQTQNSPYSLSHYGGSSSMTQASRDISTPNGTKPAVGTDEWHKVRRDNHKEVERRRRETINEGINELAKIVPGCEKNKGSILARAVTYINELKQREEQAGEKKVLEKVVLEQAVQELMARNEEIQKELKRARRENDILRSRLGTNNLPADLGHEVELEGGGDD